MGSTILILDQGGIARRIAEARKLRSLTQDGLAMRIPCSKSLISHTRNHPMARETVVALIRVHYTIPESLRSMAARMGVS